MPKIDIPALRVLYCNIMSEIKGRHELLAEIARGKYGLPSVAANEFIYLELRMICELIALGCLAAHGDIPATHSGQLRKLWKPSDILERLGDLHPNFYPVPAEEEVENGYLVGAFENPAIKHLTKRELLRLYSVCGRVLHRGSMKNLSQQTVSQADFNKTKDWASKLKGLLNRHLIHLRDPQKKLYVVMRSKENDGRVTAIDLQLK